MIKKIYLFVLFLFVVSSAMASTLDFNVATINNDGFNGTLPNYGNRIAGAGTETINMTSGPVLVTYAAPGAEDATPNIATDSAAFAKYYGTGYGDLAKVAYVGVSGDAWGWLYGFIPDASHQVKFHSIKASRWGGGTESNYVQIQLVKASDFSTVVWDSGQVAFPVNSSTHVDITIDHTGAVGEALWLFVRGDDTDLYGFDDLVISQLPAPIVLPEKYTLLDFNVDADNNDHFDADPNDFSPLYGSRVASPGDVNVWMTDADGVTVEQNLATYTKGATPDIDVDWGTSLTKEFFDVDDNDNRYGDLDNVVFANVSGTATGYLMNFVPDADYQVKVHSLNIGSWTGVGGTCRIEFEDPNDSFAIVWSSGTITIPAGDNHVAVEVDHTGDIDQNLWMTITAVSPSTNTNLFAVDDIVITQLPGPPLECGDWGYLDADTSGPTGVPDCYVDIHDFAQLALDWLGCTQPGDTNCTP